MGGAISKARLRPVAIDRKKAAFTRALYHMPPEEGDTFADVESSMYSHYGGQMSGKGAAFDPPHVRKFVTHTLKSFPKLLHTYNMGRVPNPPQRQVPFRRGGREPDIINYGGSLPQVTHSENGRLVHFDEKATGRSHYYVRHR